MTKLIGNYTLGFSTQIWKKFFFCLRNTKDVGNQAGFFVH